MQLTPVARTRLEKAAVDNGFDLDLGSDEHWLRYGSSQAPLRLWMSALGDGFFVVALSQFNVVEALAGLGAAISNPIPQGAAGARSVADIPSLHQLLRRAFQLSRALPDQLLHAFQARVASLPRETEAERLVVQRVGQDVFREGLLEYWEGRCAVTGLDVPELLRASHIKPWADCDEDAHRLDVFNGLLLAPHLDAAFDRGFITVADDGTVVVADDLGAGARVVLGLDAPLQVRRLADGHRRYLPWHRGRVHRDRR
ncbi:MAG: HNH endonuclease [Myxococcota bacterium]